MPKAGELISATQNTATSTQASGVWNLNQAYDFVRTNQWPNATGIGRSLIFNAADSAYLERTPATAGNRKTWTWSAWVKRGNLGITAGILSAGAASQTTNRVAVFFLTTDQIWYRISIDGTDYTHRSTQVFRDVSSWYHIVVQCDTTQSEASDRKKIYINGERITDFVSEESPNQNADTLINASEAHGIGSSSYSGGSGFSDSFFDGYMAEINFIDGAALEPDAFGRVDSEFGHWVPRRYSGNYGTNGFYLDFSDSSSNSALGTDRSGNANDWAPNNFNANEDLVTDSPTEYGTDFGRGGEVRGNFATMNPLDKNSQIQLLNGNLDMLLTVNVSGSIGVRASIAVERGKWYWETSPTFLADARPNYSVGIDPTSRPIGAANNSVGGGRFSDSYAYSGSSGVKITDASSTAYGEEFDVSDVIGVALDMDNGTIEFYKNGVSQGIAFSNISGTYAPSIGLYTDAASSPMQMSGTINFGQKPFAYPAPEGFRCLTTRNLEQPSIVPGDYFNTVLYTGNGGTQSITGVGFQPDFVWMKNRALSQNHNLFDIVRGDGLALFSNSAQAEFDAGNRCVFTSTGFTTDGSLGSTRPLVAWNWKAGGAGVTNTDGSITSTVSASPESGFSIVSYEGDGSDGTTVGHGLSKQPQLSIIKNRDNTSNWDVTFEGISGGTSLNFDTTTSVFSPTQGFHDVGISTLSLKNGGSGIPRVNESNENYIAYCFHSVEGFSKFGSYEGANTLPNTFVYTGFKPAFVMVKDIDNGTVDSNWYIFDNKRSPFNALNERLSPNLSGAENSYYTSAPFDFYSNGFAPRNTNKAGGTGSTFIYMAFAETPFKLSRAR